MKKLLSTLILFTLFLNSYAQKSTGGTPLSLNPKLSLSDAIVPSHEIRKPNLATIQAEDAANDRDGGILRFATLIPTNLNLQQDGQWFDLPNGDRVWKLRIHAPDAQAISLQYSHFFLPKGAKMYIYNEHQTDWLGAFTSLNNKKVPEFATGNLLGDVSIIEYYEPAAVRGQGVIDVSNIGYAYRHVVHPDAARDFCEVDVNCNPEGTNWQDIKRGVVRILVSGPAGLGWCSGSMMNNTSQDCTPYVLTALHCGENSTTANFNQYIFYFNYENTNCNGNDASSNQSIVGCTRRADSADGGGNQGSDFLLVEINDNIPESYNTYLNGWNANNTPSNSGVGIHHPAGDPKKISTYNDALSSATWNGVPNTHWLVTWISTTNGHGVTEGGSSGSPIFDTQGRVMGQLTGGSSFCDSPNNPDLYGKMSYNWTENPNPANEKLSVWLDPDNTGALTMSGTYASNCGLGITANPSTQTGCPSNSVEYALTLSSAATTSASFTTSGLPSGASASFSPNSAQPGGTTTMTINLNGGVNEGTYEFVVTASGGGLSSDIDLTLVVISGSPAMPSPISPADGATADVPSVFSWTDSGAGISYEIQIATDNNFSNIVETGVAESNTYFTSALSPATNYFWRVRSLNACTESNYTSTQQLSTSNVECFVFENNSPVTISENGTPFISSDIQVTEDFEISDVSVEIAIAHSWIGDLEATLNSPNGGNVQVFSRPGVPALSEFGCNQDNINAVFTDASPNLYSDFENTCNLSENLSTTAIAGVYQGDDAMADLDNTDSGGFWTLNLSDAEDQDGGELISWALHVCRTVTIDLPSIASNEALTVANGQTETIETTHLFTQDDNSDSDEIVYILNDIPEFGTLLLNGFPLQNGDTFTQEDIDNGSLEYQHNGAPSDSDSFNFDVMNANGGTLSGNIFNLIIETPALMAAINVDAMVTCADFGDAQISVAVTGGIPPYVYSLDGGNFQDEDFFLDVEAGTHTVSVIDDAGTETSAGMFTIENPAVINVSAEAVENNIIVTASGGTGDLMYSLDGQNFQSESTFSNQANGTYTVSVQDDNGCVQIVELTVDFSSLTAVLILEQAVSCFDAADGILVIENMGGTAPYQYRLNGGAWQDSGTFFDLVAGDYIGEVMDSEATIVETQMLTLDNPEEIEIEVLVNNDEITINASGGTGTLEYSLDEVLFSENNVFSDLPNGDYVVSVRDEAGCIATTTATVANNSIMAVAILDNDITCQNENDGQIHIEVTGGTPPYQFSLNNGGFQESPIFTGLFMGTYTGRVTDSEGFIRETNQITITNPSAISVDPIVNDDMITVLGDGGTGVLMYSIDGVNFQDSNVFSNLSNGDYAVTVMDENGCTETENATIGVNNLAVVANLVNDIMCFNANNAQIQVLVQGGSPSYMYSLNDGPFQSSNIFDGLGAGEYVATVMDSEGFSRNSNVVTITNPTEIVVSSSIDGNQVTINASGGTGQLMYNIDGGPFSTNNVFSDLEDGSYNFVVQDDNACMVNLLIFVGAQDLMAVAILVNDITCHDSNDAVINVEAQGGVSNYTYRLNDGPLQSSPVFSNLAEGTYTVTVMDGQGTSQNTNQIIITNPPVITIEADSSGDEITITASGGTGQLMYSIDGENFQESNIFSDLNNGNYIITVMDANECSVTSEVPVSVNDIMAVAVLNNELACYNDSDAQIVVQVMGGTQPYQFSLNNGVPQSMNVFNDLGEGTYTVTVIDAEGFTRPTNMLVIDQPAEITANPVDVGTMITVNASGGTGQLMYSIDGENFQESDVFSNLPNGTYTITVVDANGCMATFEATVAMNNIMAVAVLTEEISCYNTEDARIIVQVTGGTQPYEFSLNGGTYQSLNVFEDIGPGVYSVVVRDAQGLIRNTNMLTIENPEEIILDLSLNINSITVMASGGVSPFTYSINGVDFQEGPVFPNLPNGTYTVTAMDDTGCIETATQIISVNNIVVMPNVENNILCFGEMSAQIQVDVSGGTPAFRYSINGGDLQESHTFTGLGAGVYVVTVFDQDGFNASSEEIIIEQPPLIEVTLDAFSDRITANASGGTGQLMYSIDGEDFQADSIFTDLANGPYTITVMDENGCTSTADATINVLPLTAGLSVSDISCTNANDGSITVSAMGGIPDYQYQLNDGVLQDSPTFSDLGSDIYLITIYDSEGRTLEVGPISFTNPSMIIALADSEVDSLFVQAVGGTGELVYSLDGDLFQPEPYFGGLTNGIYSVTVRDDNGCSLTIDNIPVVPVLLSATSEMNRDITCFNTNDGLLTVSAMGGIEPYMYSLDGENFQGSPEFGGLAAGTYTVTVMDALGVSVIANTHTFTNPAPVSFDAIASSDSIIISNPSGGTPPYEYSIDENTYQDNPIFSDLPNGTYNAIVRDANGCTASITLTISVSGLFSAADDFEFVIYPNPSSGQFFLTLPQQMKKDWTVQVFDAIGRQVYQTVFEKAAAVDTQSLVLTHLPKGTYYLRLWNGVDSAGTLLLVE